MIQVIYCHNLQIEEATNRSSNNPHQSTSSEQSYQMTSLSACSWKDKSLECTCHRKNIQTKFRNAVLYRCMLPSEATSISDANNKRISVSQNKMLTRASKLATSPRVKPTSTETDPKFRTPKLIKSI